MRTSPQSHKSKRRRGLWLGLAAVVAAFGIVAVVAAFSGVRLVRDGSALGQIQLQPFAGSIVSVRGERADGSTIPLKVSNGLVTPRTPVASGERISIAVVVRRPGWERWALGAVRRETLTVQTPVSRIADRWVTAARGTRATVRFEEPVDHVSVSGATVSGRTVTLPTTAPAGSMVVAAAARPWERLGAGIRVTWFPRSTRPVVLASPSPGARIAPLTPIRLTFSVPTASVLQGRTPSLVPHVAGRWTTLDSHTIVFRPSGTGAPFDSHLAIRFPTALGIAGAAHASTSLQLSVAPASFLRLQQLLAQEGYLPLDWTPSTGMRRPTTQGEVAMAVAPPAGRFTWRYPNSPHELRSLWRTGRPNAITRGAVMMFEHDHGLAVDGIAGSEVWSAALADAVAGTRRTAGYSYVYVHRAVPQLLTLWHNGAVVLTSPGNTGVPAAPTAVGTWPVFEHIPVGRMRGTNPDGTRYNDPGIRWISYFHGGEALHAFTRASYGTPQSLGCVELPLAAAARVWPYTPIGTLVTIEN